ncbi:MAG TPA: metallophosphoesterase, partial [Dissulfurispiraceae bacterium]
LTTAEKISFLGYFFILFAGTSTFVSVSFYLRHRRLAGLLKAAVALASAGLLALADMYMIEPNWIAVERVGIGDPALADVLRGIRIVQISDIHLQGGIGYRERRLAEKVNALQPDILFITGDFFGERASSDDVHALTSLIGELKAGYGIYGVEGNYDRPLHSPAVLKELEGAGLHVLSNETRTIVLPNGKGFCLAGLDDSKNYFLKSKLLEDLPSGMPSLVLAHNPDIFGEAARAKVNLVLAGHTHGGQVGLPFLIHMSSYANKSTFISGLFNAGATNMYVNRGIGTTRTPVRFFCRPEITVFEFSGGAFENAQRDNQQNP